MFYVCARVADKNGMDSFALIPFLESGEQEDIVMAALLASLEQMASRNHRPSSCLLVRLTDGRVKMVASPEGTHQAREEALRIRNEHGPFSAAFSIEVTDCPGGIRFVIENLGRRGPARMEHQCGFAGKESRAGGCEKMWTVPSAEPDFSERRHSLERGGLSPDFFAASCQPR
jgi:hypothetical protein